MKSEMTKVQFRVLYREFLFRIVDLELLSADALGDSRKLLGQFAALLIFLSIFFLSFIALKVGASRMPPAIRLFEAWNAEHVLIETTMLVVGLFAVLSWDSTFPQRRDVLVLAPLPVRARTLFLAKVAAVATTLSLTVVLLHSAAGLTWPLAVGALHTGPLSMPKLGYLPATPPVDAAGLGPLLKRDLTPGLPIEMGVVVGVVKHGERRILAYGTARPESIFQIASISKTFTGLLLAQMVAQGRVRLDDPVRELLPAGTVGKPSGCEITLLDLATHRSGLPPMPGNLRRTGIPNLDTADYHAADLYDYVGKHGVGRDPNPPFFYSNLGFALLGEALAARAGVSYPDLIAQQIAGPLGMRDTAVWLAPEQQRRMIQAFGVWHEPVPTWNLDAIAPAGGIRSTAGDMLTYLEAQLRADSPALRLSHELRAGIAPGKQIALAWVYDEDTGTYWHNGGISGYGSYAFFNPQGGYAGVVLTNEMSSFVNFALPLHIRQRLAGEPAISLASVTVPASGSLPGTLRLFAVYWITMLGAGAFIFCCVLALQGFAAQLLPRQLFLRASSFLQLSAFCAIVGVCFLQPGATPQALIEANGHGLLAWSPSYWFLGLFQQLNGSPALALLARRAWIGLGVALSATATAYVLSYARTLRKIVEEPDIVAGTRGGVWLPRFGNPLKTAIVQFSVRALLRSRLHRIILAFYLGVGFALVIALVNTPSAENPLPDVPAGDPWGLVNTPLLAAGIVMMCFAVIGARVVFSLPLDLRGNWIFRVTGAPRVTDCLEGARRSLLLLSAAPVWAVSAVLCFYRWPWRAAAGHLAILGLIGLILAELCLYNFDKIPFTCSYLPGKSQIHMAILGAYLLLGFTILSVEYERQALENPARFVLALIGLACVWACTRWRTAAHARSEEARVQFEEVEDPAILVLGLNRHGSRPIDPPAMS
jgi:CubicO group peptidase (beta-lactamase class C family)